MTYIARVMSMEIFLPYNQQRMLVRPIVTAKEFTTKDVMLTLTIFIFAHIPLNCILHQCAAAFFRKTKKVNIQNLFYLKKDLSNFISFKVFEICHFKSYNRLYFYRQWMVPTGWLRRYRLSLSHKWILQGGFKF